MSDHCPACKGRGGFDGDEDCYICAWCYGTGKVSVEDIVKEGQRLVRENSQLRIERDSARMANEENQEVIGELKRERDNVKLQIAAFNSMIASNNRLMEIALGIQEK